MNQEQEYAVIGRTLSERADAERAFNLLADEADSISFKMLSLAGDLRHNPESVTMDRLKEFDTGRLLKLANSLSQAKTTFREADSRAAKWLPPGTPRPIFDSMSE